MRAELVMIGTELLLGQTVDSNSAELSQALASVGIDTHFRTTVGDNRERMAAALSEALDRADVVITSGGLGPTEDDLTREVIGSVVGEPLVEHAAARRELERRFESAGRTPTKNEWRQVRLPRSAVPIPNRWGTAPGLIWERAAECVIALPGVPTELHGMLEESVLPFLKELKRRRGESGEIVSRVLRVAGIGEAALETQLRDLMRGSNPTLTPYAGVGEVKLRLTAKAADEESALRLIEPVAAEIRKRLGDRCYGEGDERLESVVGGLLSARGERVSVAESCTGGLIGCRLTGVPGSSSYFERGFVTYSNESKVEMLGVPEELLRRDGAVSERAAVAMAEGARLKAETDWAISVTGIAGPGGGSEAKPVGTVYVAVAGPARTRCAGYVFHGDREQVRTRAAQAALDLLRIAIAEERGGRDGDGR